MNAAQGNGIKVIAGFRMPWPGSWSCSGTTSVYTRSFDFTDVTARNAIKARFQTFVQTWKDHPAILFWAIGNENNLGFNTNPTSPDFGQIAAYYSLANELGQIARQVEGAYYHPVAIVEAEIGFINNSQYGTTDAQLNYIDIWGANVYRGKSFGTLFTDIVNRTNKAFWVAEYGLDAFHSLSTEYPSKGSEDQATQADWDSNMWDEIKKAYRFTRTIGGTVFVYSDGWWKENQWVCGSESKVCNSEHNHFGVGPQANCQGTITYFPAAPDNYWHSEYWGIMSVAPHPTNVYGVDSLSPRQAYTTLQTKFSQP